jgi:hypothetical protein
MNNPILSLLNKPTDNSLQIAKKAVSSAPTTLKMPERKKPAISRPDNFVQSYKDQLADDIVRTNWLQGKYDKNNMPYYSAGKYDKSNMLDYLATYETPGIDNPYTAVNKDTGAYGRYQFTPSTMKAYADKLGVTVEQFKANPFVQDRAAQLKLKDLANELKAYGIPVTKQNMYLGWQQGAKGLSQLLKGISPGYDALNMNLPKSIERTPKAFLNYWYGKL